MKKNLGHRKSLITLEAAEDIHIYLRAEAYISVYLTVPENVCQMIQEHAEF